MSVSAAFPTWDPLSSFDQQRAGRCVSVSVSMRMEKSWQVIYTEVRVVRACMFIGY